METIKFLTLGCKVNQYETQSIRERFLNSGFKEVHNGFKAGNYLVNTCTVTAIADQKSRESIRRCIKANPKARVIVTGCLVEKDASSLVSIKGIDYLISKRFFPAGIRCFYGHTRAFLKIQDGCDNFCSYCKVPLVRGRSRSRLPGEILAEAKALAAEGFKEIVLTGICLGSFGRDLFPETSLSELIQKLEDIDGLLRIRLSSIEAKDLSDELIDTIAASGKVCHHLHIPIQSGDDQILRRMNRKYSHKDYLALIKKILRYIPDIAITTDCLVGFPSETEKQFQNTADLLKKIQPLRTHIFPYSPRLGTSAFDADQVLDPSAIKNRCQKLKILAQSCSRAYRRKFINKELLVLFEGPSKGKSGYWEGYSDNYIKVLVKSRLRLANQVKQVKTRKIRDDFLLGEVSRGLNSLKCNK